MRLSFVLSAAIVASAGLSVGDSPQRPGDRLSAGDGMAVLIGQSTGGKGGTEGGAGNSAARFDALGRPLGPLGGANVPVPLQVAGVIKRSTALCRGVPEEYVIDCLIEHYRQALSVIPQSGTYAPVRRVLEDTVDKLERVVAENLDESKPPIRLKSEGTTSARMRAIRPETVRRANAEAARIVAEAETVLLRSASEHPGAQLYYARIAEAVGSNKVLLRS